MPAKEQLETINKQQIRWRSTLEENVKAIAADVQLVQAHSRAMEAAIGSNKVIFRGGGAGNHGLRERNVELLVVTAM